MQVSMNWLKDYLAKAEGPLDPRSLAEQLTMRGLSVSRISRAGTSGLDQVVVARIERVEKHPNADRLSVTQVASDASGVTRQVVCGAKNISVGDIVPLALPGAVLPGNLEIKVSSIRGIESHGMLCSGKELGIADDTEGILQLPKHSVLGQSLSRLLGSQADDTVMEFELTPNRGDCLSIFGIAKEIAALAGTSVRELKETKFKSTTHRTSSILSVEVPDPALCPRYVARVIDGFKVMESPDWIQERLKAVGQRCVNNIVDITNFVMLEYGAPLHAFDLRRIKSGTVRVDACQIEQDFTLLTGEIVRLIPGDILILDGDRPIALAGITGGLNTQVEADTTSILLEAATFNPSQIRRTAKRLGLLTEASRRFEKGIAPNLVLQASDRAAVLIRDAYSANVYHPPIDTLEAGAPTRQIAVDLREVRRILGIASFGADAAIEVLAGVGIEASKKSLNILLAKIPFQRTDLKESLDVIEEIARLYGYSKIPSRCPNTSAAFDRLDETKYRRGRSVRELMAGLGLRECIHYSFVSDALLRKLSTAQDRQLKLLNPLSEEMAVLRTSLLPSLIGTYSFNRNRNQPNQALFEVGNVYHSAQTGETGSTETLSVAALMAGTIRSNSWNGKPVEVDFFHAKGLVEGIISLFGSQPATFVPAGLHPVFHPNRSSEIFIGAHSVGIVGELHPHSLKELEAQSMIVAFELDLEALGRFSKKEFTYIPPSKFPTVEFDIAIWVDKTVSAAALLETIQSTASSLLRATRVFDVYEGDKAPFGKRSIAFRMSFGTSDHTLQEAETAPIIDRVVKALSEKHNAELRK